MRSTGDGGLWHKSPAERVCERGGGSSVGARSERTPSSGLGRQSGSSRSVDLARAGPHGERAEQGRAAQGMSSGQGESAKDKEPDLL